MSGRLGRQGSDAPARNDMPLRGESESGREMHSEGRAEQRNDALVCAGIVLKKLNRRGVENERATTYNKDAAHRDGACHRVVLHAKMCSAMKHSGLFAALPCPSALLAHTPACVQTLTRAQPRARVHTHTHAR